MILCFFSLCVLCVGLFILVCWVLVWYVILLFLVWNGSCLIFCLHFGFACCVFVLNYFCCGIRGFGFGDGVFGCFAVLFFILNWPVLPCWWCFGLWIFLFCVLGISFRWFYVWTQVLLVFWVYFCWWFVTCWLLVYGDVLDCGFFVLIAICFFWFVRVGIFVMVF